MAARKPRAARARRPSGEGGETPYWLYGRHAVAAAGVNPARRVIKLLASDGAGGIAGAEPASREAIAALLPAESVHQGVAALVAPLAPPELATVLGATAPLVVLDRVSDPRNVGAVLRSAAAFGAAAVIVTRRHAPPETGALAKAASGALEEVPLVRVTNLVRALRQIAAAGFWVIGLDAGAPRTLAAATPPRRSALVLGAEGAGLRRLTGEACDELARLPIGGAVASLNVSAAAAAALYELARLSEAVPRGIVAGPRGAPPA